MSCIGERKSVRYTERDILMLIWNCMPDFTSDPRVIYTLTFYFINYTLSLLGWTTSGILWIQQYFGSTLSKFGFILLFCHPKILDWLYACQGFESLFPPYYKSALWDWDLYSFIVKSASFFFFLAAVAFHQQGISVNKLLLSRISLSLES